MTTPARALGVILAAASLFQLGPASPALAVQFDTRDRQSTRETRFIPGEVRHRVGSYECYEPVRNAPLVKAPLMGTFVGARLTKIDNRPVGEVVGELVGHIDRSAALLSDGRMTRHPLKAAGQLPWEQLRALSAHGAVGPDFLTRMLAVRLGLPAERVEKAMKRAETRRKEQLNAIPVEISGFRGTIDSFVITPTDLVDPAKVQSYMVTMGDDRLGRGGEVRFLSAGPFDVTLAGRARIRIYPFEDTLLIPPLDPSLPAWGPIEVPVGSGQDLGRAAGIQEPKVSDMRAGVGLLGDGTAWLQDFGSEAGTVLNIEGKILSYDQKNTVVVPLGSF